MFPTRYFPNRYYAPRYWAKVGATGGGFKAAFARGCNVLLGAGAKTA